MSSQPTSPLPPQALADTPQSALSALDQYRAYLQDLGNFGTRHTTSNSFYLSIITALLGLLTLMRPSEGLSDLRTLLRILVPLFGMALCWVWHKTMLFYSAMYRVKFDVLRELERHGGLYPVFEREKNLLWPRPWLSQYEHWIPLFLAMPFAAVLVAAVWRLFRPGV